MSRVDTKPQDILSWILGLLRNGLGLGPEACFLASDDLAPARIPPHPTFCVLSPLGSQFIIDEQTPGNVCERWGFRVRLFLRISRDRPGQDEVRLLDADDGMFAWKLKLLRALVGKDNQDWNLRGTLAATAATPLVWLRGNRGEIEYASFAVDFLLEFDWSLE